MKPFTIVAILQLVTALALAVSTYTLQKAQDCYKNVTPELLNDLNNITTEKVGQVLEKEEEQILGVLKLTTEKLQKDYSETTLKNHEDKFIGDLEKCKTDKITAIYNKIGLWLLIFAAGVSFGLILTILFNKDKN